MYKIVHVDNEWYRKALSTNQWHDPSQKGMLVVWELPEQPPTALGVPRLAPSLAEINEAAKLFSSMTPEKLRISHQTNNAGVHAIVMWPSP